jgi:hypothetical protein
MTSRLDRLYMSIYSVSKELNTRGAIPSYRQKDLEDRLVIAFKEPGRQPRAEVPREQKQILANSRENKARKVYLQVLDEDGHVFLPFILAISPRACVSFDLDRYFRYHEDRRCGLQLSVETKGLLEGIARRRGFIQNPHYKKLVQLVFPQGL